MSDHIQRLTLCNRQLVKELNDARDFIKSLLDPDLFGYSVSPEVRNEAKRIIVEGTVPKGNPNE